MLTNMQISRGDNWVTENGITVKHPRLNDLTNYLSGDVYAFTRLFCLQPQDIHIDLWASGIDFEALNDFELFLILYKNNKNKHDMMFSEFMGINHCELSYSDDDVWLIGMDEKDVPITYIDFKTYSELTVFFKKITCFENAKRPKYSSKENKKRILDMEVEDMDNSEKKEDDNIHQLISALVWGNTSGYNWNNVWDLTFYQFNDGLRRLDKIKHSQALWSGYYSGNIDAKKIPQKDFDWRLI